MIGEILKNRREELGLDLKEAAHTLRIQYEYLKALENNILKKLPPAVYTRGYIREYARFLGVDPAPLLDEYAGQTKPEENIQPEPPPEKKKLAFTRGVLLLPLIIALVSVIIIFFPKSKPPSNDPHVEHANSPAVMEPLPLPSSGHTRASPLPVSSGAGHVLNIVATETTWLRIEIGDGKSEEVLMKPGESKNWTSQKGFDLKLGNAGGVRLVFNGKDLGIPGGKGHVLRLKLPLDNRPQQNPG